ncbi:MAG TPA: hypothetical protein VGM39_02500 [Kofleriaceae bacterium]|jgi:hypothetical protein
MAAASLDELRFFLDDRDDIAQRIHATGATTTQVMAAIGAHEHGETLTSVPDGRLHEVLSILDEEYESIEIDVDDLREAA